MTTSSRQHLVGLDLGQQGDWSALCVLDRQETSVHCSYDCVWLKRWPLGTPYPEIVCDTLALLARDELIDPLLVVDQTGVGRPVVDLFRAQSRCALLGVTITAGLTPNRDPKGDGIRVPKKDLVACLQVLLGHRRLSIAASLQYAAVLQKELENFRVKISAAGNELFSAWRENDKDDLVLALAVACWVGEHAYAGGPISPPPESARSIVAQAPAGVFMKDDDDEGKTGPEKGEAWPDDTQWLPMMGPL